MPSSWGLRVLVALVALAAASGVWAKGSPIRTERALEGQVRRASKKVIKRHLKLIKALQKEAEDPADVEWHVWAEAQAVLRLDPKNRKAQRLVGEDEPPPPAKVPAGYVTGRAEVDASAQEELGGLVARCEAGGLSGAGLEELALLVLAYAPGDAGARKALGFVGKPGDWKTARERAIQAAYNAAWKATPAPRVLAACPWPKLEKALGLKLSVVEGKRAFAACVASTPRALMLKMIARSADVAYDAIHHDLLGEVGSFKSPEARGKVTGVKLGEFHRPLFLLLENKAQHLKFLDGVVDDPQLRASGKTIGMVTTVWQPERLVVSDHWRPGYYLKEWPAQRMVFFFVRMRFGPRRPSYLVQGLARYYSGHVSRQARVRLVSTGSRARGGAAVKVGGYPGIRELARRRYDGFQAAPPLERGMFKTVESTTRGDNAIASAFVDYLLAKDRAKILELLSAADGRKRRLPESIKQVFGEDTGLIDRSFGAWLVRNY